MHPQEQSNAEESSLSAGNTGIMRLAGSESISRICLAALTKYRVYQTDGQTELL